MANHHACQELHIPANYQKCYITLMYNWSVDTKKLARHKDKHTIWKPEQHIHFGLNEAPHAYARGFYLLRALLAPFQGETFIHWLMPVVLWSSLCTEELHASTKRERAASVKNLAPPVLNRASSQNREKINKEKLVKNWPKLDIDLNKKAYLHFLIWEKS